MHELHWKTAGVGGSVHAVPVAIVLAVSTLVADVHMLITDIANIRKNLHCRGEPMMNCMKHSSGSWRSRGI